MSAIGPASSFEKGTVKGSGKYAVGNNGDYFAVGRKCRHFQADLGNGSIDADGCLVCPWHGAKYDVKTGRMVLGPQKIFAKIPGVGPFFKGLTAVVPLRRGRVTERNGDLFLDD